MDTFSFFVCVSLWTTACILLIAAIFGDGGAVEYALCLFMAGVAMGYNWYHNEKHGKPLLFSAYLPPPVVEVIGGYSHAVQAARTLSYHRDTPQAVVRLLEDARRNRTVVRVYYGNVETGREERSEAGYVNCSPGAIQIPLLGRDAGGGTPIQDHCIVKVFSLSGNVVLYEHPAFHTARDRDPMKPVRSFRQSKGVVAG